MISEESKRQILSNPYYVIFIDKKDGQSVFVRVKNLSLKEFDEFKSARDVINQELLEYNDIYLMVSRAHDNLNEAYSKKVEAVGTGDYAVNARDDLVELNSYFIGFIANMSMYLSVVPRKISSSRKNVFNVHTLATNEEYDNHFGYRLMTALRNYALHNKPPITGIKGSRMINEPSEYEIYIEKSTIIIDKEVAKKLEKDFIQPVEHYPIIENIDEAMHSLSRIHWKTIKALIAEIEESIALIESITKLVAKQGKQPYVAEFIENAETGALDAEIHFVPTHILGIKINAQKW